MMGSRTFIESFIDERKLLPDLFPDTWNAVKDAPTPAKAVKYFQDHILDVSQDKKTGLVTVEVEWRDRSQAAEWANDLVRRLNREMGLRSKAAADASISYLQQELVSTSSVETRDAISRLIEAQVKQRMLASVSQEFSFRVVEKAVPPDADDIAKPNRLLLILAGPLCGALLAIVGCIARRAWRLA